MVITVSNIHESIDDIFHDVEIFTMETCHEIDMITLQSRFLNEAEENSQQSNSKIKQLVNAIINKAKELADKVSRTINEIIMTFYNKYANFRSGKLKKYPKEDMKDAINKAIDQYKDAKIYTAYNVSYHTIFDRLKSKNVDMTVESIMKNIDKRDIEYDDINNELTYTYYNNWRNFKVVPFSNSEISQYLPDYQSVYNTYKDIVLNYDDTINIENCYQCQ